MWDEIPERQRCSRWSLGMDKWFYPTLYLACHILSMLGSNLIRVSKDAPGFWQYGMLWLLTHEPTS